MIRTQTRHEVVLARWGRATVVIVLLAAAVEWASWTTIKQPALASSAWLEMTPWAVLCLALLAAAVLLLTANLSPAWLWAGFGFAAAATVLSGVFLVEYATGRSFGLDLMWFAEQVQVVQEATPGRPGQRMTLSILLVSVAVPLTRVDRPWTWVTWPLLLIAAAIGPLFTIAATVFGAPSAMGAARSIGQGIAGPLGLLLLVAAIFALRADRNPGAWLLARPDRVALARLVGILSGLPLFVALLRYVFVTAGLHEEAAWVLAITVGAAFVGAAAFYVTQREQKLILDAEARYHILADNAVDVVVRLRGNEITWISPSVQAALGTAPSELIGSDFRSRVYPDDVDVVVAALNRIVPGEPVAARFRVHSVDDDYHWIDGHVKPYIDGDGNTDGAIAALRVVDLQVEAEQKLQQLARFDTLTGLANRAEALSCLETALVDSRTPGTYLGILFCDIDYFKDINDTWGHAIGDVVLATLATRIRECVRTEDTVGRLGGDEILVLLPGIHNLNDAAHVAEEIRSRAAAPIHQSGITVNVTLSIGATLAVVGETVTTMMARADGAMYEAKNSGRNRVTRLD